MTDVIPPTSSRQVELTTILEGIGEGFYALDRDWRITRFNSVAAQHFKRTPEEAIGRNLWELFPSARETELGRVFHEAMASRKPVLSETPSVVMPGRWLAFRLFPLSDGMGVFFRDITDRKRAEEQRDLLLRELHHRVNNTFATVQAIAAQSFRSSADTAARAAFDARLLTLSNVHKALTQENWDGVTLHKLVETTLAPHQGADAQRFSVAGPDMLVKPKSAIALSMALHELCTNALKYGALSTEAGRILIAWEESAGRFRLCWQERGGPPVISPTDQGFGTAMIERVLGAQLDGEVAISYQPAGVVCTIDAPITGVRDESGRDNR